MSNEYLLKISIVLIGIISIYSYYRVITGEQKKEKEFIIKNNKFFENDNILVDAPTSKDKIGFNDYAEVISESIMESKTFSVYGIYGHWGTGKTSLMYMIKELLESNNKVIWFDSWRFKGKVSIFDALCNVIHEELNLELKNSYVKSIFDKVMSEIDKSERKTEYNIKQLNMSKNDFGIVVNYLNKYTNKKIIIFIDDLDRCEPSEAVIFLENLKVFFDVPQITFVIGVNYDILRSEVNKKFKDLSNKDINYSEEYLSKIMNMPFFIPEIDRSMISKFIIDNVTIKEVVEVSNIFVIGFDKNLRSVKRGINSYNLMIKIAKKRLIEIDNALLAKMLVIKYRYREIYNKIILMEDYIFILQEIATDRFDIDFQRRNSRNEYMTKIASTTIESKDRFIRLPNGKRVNIDKELYNIPEELKELLRLKPFFQNGELIKYISLLQEEKINESNNNMKLEASYLEEFNKGNFEIIKNLSVFSLITRKEIENKLLDNFSRYSIDEQKEAVRILKTSTNREIQNKLYNILKVGEIEEISLKRDIIQGLIQYRINISSYVQEMVKKFDMLNINDKRFLLDICLMSINMGEKYCIDILSNIIDKLDFIESDYILRESIVEALGRSKDKKSLDILTRFIEDKSTSVIEKTLNSIGMLDIEYLVDLYNLHVYNSELRRYFIIAIINHEKGESLISNKIILFQLLNFLSNESDELTKISLIKLISLIMKINSRNKIEVMEQEFTNCKKLLNDLARHGETWIVRDEAQKALNNIEILGITIQSITDMEVPF